MAQARSQGDEGVRSSFIARLTFEAATEVAASRFFPSLIGRTESGEIRTRVEPTLSYTLFSDG